MLSKHFFVLNKLVLQSHLYLLNYYKRSEVLKGNNKRYTKSKSILINVNF